MIRAVLVSIAIVLTSCMPQTMQRSVPPCPPPPAPPACMPGYTETVVYDTSRMIGNVRWRIRRVLGANTSVHEWGLLPVGDQQLLVRGRSPAQAMYYTARLDREDVVTLTPLLSGTTTMVTTIVPRSITGDASVAAAVISNGEAVADSTIDFTLNVPLYWDGHPSVSSDGTTLVFASDRPGGMGGTDLWYSKKVGSTWSAPQLVQGLVNTPCDELCPQFAGDSVLLFSSAGHSTVGGYDLFAASIDHKESAFTLGEPRNLGPPVNTKFDELFPVWRTPTTLYYASDQPSRGNTDRKDFDVFVLTSARLHTDSPVDVAETPEQPELELPEQTPVTVTGTVIREDTKQPVSGAEVTATNPDNNVVVATTTSDTVGKYTLSVPPGKPIDIQAQTPELFFDKVRVDVPSPHSQVEIASGARPDTVHIAKPLSLPTTFVLRVNFPTAIYDVPYAFVLDSNGYETRNTWQRELDILADNVKNSGIRMKRLVLIGHTDDVDTDANNLVLGKNRVNFIIDQLVSRGVDRSLLEGRSAGETLLPNRRQGESLILWRKRARRVELVKVLHE